MEVLRGKLIAAEITKNKERLNTFDCDGFFPTGGNFVIMKLEDFNNIQHQIRLAASRIETSFNRES